MDMKDKEHAIADLNNASKVDVAGKYKKLISGMLRKLELGRY